MKKREKRINKWKSCYPLLPSVQNAGEEGSETPTTPDETFSGSVSTQGAVETTPAEPAGDNGQEEGVADVKAQTKVKEDRGYWVFLVPRMVRYVCACVRTFGTALFAFFFWILCFFEFFCFFVFLNFFVFVERDGLQLKVVVYLFQLNVLFSRSCP